MGLDGEDLLDDGDGVGGGGGGGDGEGKASAAVSCSICLDAVTDNGDRSWAKLQCGHQFHLDCIGSAFNIKGAMQCPNCRKIEKGQWLYATGCRQLPEFSMDDFAHDEDLYDLSYSEMRVPFTHVQARTGSYEAFVRDVSFGVHWCPFSGLTRLPSSFEEGEYSSTAYHELFGQHAILPDHTPISSASHPCPYIAYFGPVHPSSSNSNASISDGSNFNNHWNGASVPNEIPTSYAFPGIDVHYHSWDHHASPFPTTSSRIGGADQPSIPSGAQRAARTNDIPRMGSLMHPFIVGHSSAARAGSSVASSMIPPHPGSVARTRDRVQALQAYFQQPSNTPSIRNPVMSGSRRSSTHRSVAQVGAVASSSDQTGAFYFFPSSSSGRTYQEAEIPLPARFHGWDREHLPSFPLSQIDRDSGWGPFHQAAGGSDGSLRTNSFRQRHGPTERMPSQNRS